MKTGAKKIENYDNKTNFDWGKDYKKRPFLEKVAIWGSFYRANPVMFVKDYFPELKLKLFQMILLHMMFVSDFALMIATRGIGKSFLVALYVIIRAILYPNSKIIVATAVKSQSRALVQQKIQGELLRICPNLRNEIEDIKISNHQCEVIFKNGSIISAINCGETVRGLRANVIVYDESRLISKKARDTIIRPFLNYVRYIPALNKPEYKHLTAEDNTEIAITSSWYKDSELWEDFNAFLNKMISFQNYVSLGFAYSLSVFEGLLPRKRVEQVRSEDNFDQATFDMEYNSLFGGSFEDAYYKIDEFQKHRNVERAFIPMTDLEAIGNQGKRKKQYPLQAGEIRIISADIALMSGNENDNTIIDICRLIPKGDYYERQFVYTESCNGQHTDTIALRIKRLYYEFDCSYVALDCQGNGLSIFDALVKNTYDKTLDIEYPMWNCINDEKMAERGNKNALKCIYSIKATPELNHIMHNAFKNDLGRGKIQILIDDVKAKELYSEKTSFLKMSPYEQGRLLKPYLETTIFINETIALEMSIISGGYIKLSERSNKARKDRYSSRLYNNYIARILEKKYLNPNKNRKKSILDAVFFM